MKTVAAEIKGLDEKLDVIEAQLQVLMYELPNLPDASVPAGREAAENVRSPLGRPAGIRLQPKTHDEIGEQMGILDFKKAGEVTGARFVFMKGIAARLERALINFMLDTHREKGYEEMVPPFMVNRDALFGTGQFPNSRRTSLR